MRKNIQTERAPKAVGPYSQAVQCGNMLFVSGQIGLDPASGGLVPGGIREQAQQVLENLRGVVEAAGLSLSDTVKCTCFLRSMEDFSAFNEVYARYFADALPARECVEVARLPKDALVEVSAVCMVA